MALQAHTNPDAWRADVGAVFTMENDDGSMDDVSREDMLGSHRDHADLLGVLEDMRGGHISLALGDLGRTPAIFMDYRRRYNRHRAEQAAHK